MKKIFTSLVMAILPFFAADTFAADITTPLFATFESGAAPFVLNGNGPGSDIKTQVIIDNPDKSENITSKCVKIDKTGAEWWHKTGLQLEDGTVVKQASANHKYLHFFVKYPDGANGVEVGIYKPGDMTTAIFQGQIDYTNTSGWHDVVIDLTGKITAEGIAAIWFRPFNTIMYLDEFELSDSATPRTVTKITTPLFATFESGTAAPFVLNADGNGSEIKTQVIANNPDKEENMSSKCIKVEKPANWDWYFKTLLKLEDNTIVKQASENHKYLHFFVKYPEGSNGIETAIFKPGDMTTAIFQGQIDYTNTSGWHDVVIDLTGKITAEGIAAIWIRPFYGSNTTMYLDEFELSDSATPRAITKIKTPLFGTFDDGNATPFVLNADGPGSDMKTQEISDNTFKKDNITAKTIKFTASEGIQWWHKTYFKMQDKTMVIPASADHKYLHFYLMSPTNTSGVEVGVLNISGELIYQTGSIEWDATAEWHDVVIDLTANLGDKPGITDNNIAGIWIRPFGLESGKIYYIDQFELGNSASPRIVKNINTPLFATFEDGTAAPFILNGDGQGSDIKNQVITDNVLKLKNTTDKAIQLTGTEGVQWWHKTYFKVEDYSTIVPASADHKYLHFYMMSPTNTSGVEVGVYNIAGEQIYQTGGIEWAPTAEWLDVVIDLTADLNGKPGITGNNIAGMWVRPFGMESGKVYYFDEFELSSKADSRIESGNSVNHAQLKNIELIINNGRVTISGDEIASIAVYGLNGTLIQNNLVENNEVTLPLLKGAYIIQVTTKDGQIIVRKAIL